MFLLGLALGFALIAGTEKLIDIRMQKCFVGNLLVPEGKPVATGKGVFGPGVQSH